MSTLKWDDAPNFCELMPESLRGCATDPLWEAVFRQILLERKTRTMQSSVAEKVVAKLAGYSRDTVQYALEAYTDREVVGEAYLLGIARSESKRSKLRIRTDAHVTEDPSLDFGERKKDPGLPLATEHLTWVLGELRTLYRADKGEHRALIKETAWAVRNLADRTKEGSVSARIVDKEATELEKQLRVAIPGGAIPIFTPYGP